jgi:cell division protein FtsX
MTAGRHGPILRSAPWARAGLGLTLTVVAAIGVLTLIVDAAALRTVGAVGPRLAGQATVVVWSHGLESADAAAARAGEIIAALPGVRSVAPLEPASSDALFGRLLGAPSGAGGEQRLLAVEVSGEQVDRAAGLESALAAQGIPARAADHDWKASAPARTTAAIVAAGAFIPVAAVIAFAIAGAMAAGREMARAAGVIEMMRIAGASDGYLSRLVRGRVASLALTSALWAAAAGLIAAAAVARTSLAEPLGGLTRADLLSPWPLIVPCAWLAAAAAGWLAARGALRKRR